MAAQRSGDRDDDGTNVVADRLPGAALLGLDPAWSVHHAISVGWPAPGPTGPPAIATGRRSLQEVRRIAVDLSER